MTPFFIIGFVIIMALLISAQRRVTSAFSEFAQALVASGVIRARTARRIRYPAEIRDVMSRD